MATTDGAAARHAAVRARELGLDRALQRADQLLGEHAHRRRRPASA